MKRPAIEAKWLMSGDPADVGDSSLLFSGIVIGIDAVEGQGSGIFNLVESTGSSFPGHEANRLHHDITAEPHVHRNAPLDSVARRSLNPQPLGRLSEPG